MTEYRQGIGWDIHRLAAGKKLILGGVEIPSEAGLEGHSDADVLSHAITDALLGAAGLGDIGLHFPDTDPRWRGADSTTFLRHALRMLRERRWRVVHVDSTVVLERPKLAPHREAIRRRLAAALELEPECVSVKFKTAEGLGPAGEGRAAEAHAVVTLSRDA
ncbi:MAG: 2-C-methyl-D-erythritol 2,4-cyclodiphosphate synthase [Bryobacteraceae bacterium]|nr:2-C-methyl-D-erythritol 2,4-cyclodiphosphate synthase [Bryobacteraceae bacterium]